MFMRQTIAIPTLAGVLVLSACQTHQAKVADLQKQYDEVNQQFAKDCSAEMMELPQKLSPKCTDESKKLKEVTERLQAEQAKK
jgi:protein involved in sex pheromone biosynthesis